MANHRRTRVQTTSLRKNCTILNHSWQRVPNPLFYEHPHILLTPLPALFVFFSWMCYHAISNVLFYLTIWRTYTCQALIPYHRKYLAMCLPQSSLLASSLLYCLTQMTWLLLVVWFDVTHTQIHTQYTQGPIDWYVGTCYVGIAAICIALKNHSLITTFTLL